MHCSRIRIPHRRDPKVHRTASFVPAPQERELRGAAIAPSIRIDPSATEPRRRTRIRARVRLIGGKHGKVVVVTGASAGAGRAAAREFARCGCDVALLARNGEALDNARAEVESHGRRALAIPLDMADAEAVKSATFAIESQIRPIDVWAIVWASRQRHREAFVGSSTVAAIWGNRFVAPLLDRYLARSAYRAQLAPAPIEPNRRDNLWQTVPGDHGAHGRFTDRASGSSRELRMSTHRRLLLSACAAGAGLALLAAARSRRRHLRPR